jgi:hypothetical protein
MKVCAVCTGQPFNIEDHLVEVPNPVEPVTTSATATNGTINGHSNGTSRSTSPGSINGPQFTSTNVVSMGNSVGILKSELNNSINLSSVTQQSANLSNTSNSLTSGPSIVLTGNNHHPPSSGALLNGNAISITNTSSLNTPLKSGDDELSNLVGQVAEQVIIDTTHTYSLPDPNLVKKEPRSPIRPDKIAVSIHQMPTTA